MPIIEYINSNIDKFKMSEFLKLILLFRKNNQKECEDRIRELMP